MSKFMQGFLQDLKRDLLIDDEWYIDHDDGFEWWPGPYSQRIRMIGPKEFKGMKLYKVSATTKILSIKKKLFGKNRTEQALLLLNRYPLLNSYVYDKKQSVVSICSSCYFPEASKVGYLYWTSISAAFQVALGAIGLELLPELCGGHVFTSNHPARMVRTDLDDLTNIIASLEHKVHEMFSSRIAIEIDKVGKFLNDNTDFLTNYEEDQLTTELPFISEEPAVMKYLNLTDGSPYSETVLLRILTVDQHPKLNEGFLVQISLPIRLSEKCITELNRIETERFYGTHVFGAWTNDHTLGPTHSIFLPFVVYKDNTLLNTVLSMILRSQNVREFTVFPDRLKFC